MPKPIRVLHVLGSLNAGGAESRVMDIYRHINRNEVQFDFAIHTSKKSFFTEEVLELGARIFILPKFKGLNYLEYKTAWKSLLKNNRDITIIHGHMTTTAFIYLNIAKKMGIKKRIAHARNSNKDSYIKKILSKLARFYATDLLAVSNEAAISEFGQKRTQKKVQILPNLFDYKKFEFSTEKRNNIRRELNISNKDNVLVHIGRFHKQKNHFFLINLFLEHLKDYSETHLILVGNGPLLNNVKSYVKNKDVDNQIHFLDVRKDVTSILSASDVMVFPSIYEGLPGVLIEAQINRLPIIVSQNVTKEVKISDRIYFYNLKDKGLWKKAINYCLNINREDSRKLDNKFEIKQSLHRYYDLYCKIRKVLIEENQ